MKNIRFYFLFLMIVPVASIRSAELPPPLKNVEVSTTINFDQKSEIYTYIYGVYNPSSNVGQITHFEIDISSAPNDVILSGEGLVNGSCYRKYGSELSSKRVKMIPVGMDVPPGYIPKYIDLTGAYVTTWSCGLSARGSASWGSGDEDYRILPGQKLGDFKLTSYGIPGIRSTIVEPDYVMDMEDLPEEAIENAYEYVHNIEMSIAYHGKTLGPTAPPADFKPMAFIDYIISLKHEAATLGWIKNEGIINSLDVKLENAKKAIERNNIRPAKNVLEAFVSEVEAQGCASYEKCPEGKHLTPEAYGLLKYNAEYLLERL